MDKHYKQYLSLTGLLIVIVSLVAGIAFGGAAGYVVGSELVLRVQPSIQPVVNNVPLNTEQIRLRNSGPITPTQPKHVVGEEYSSVEAVNMVLPAVVTVIGREREGIGSGSGFFISSEGYVVTNNHVIENAQELAIIYAEGGTAPATVVGAAPEFDLAVLKVEGPVPAVVEWGDSADLPLGTNVIAIGSALGRYQNTVTAGVLSGFDRELGGLHGLLQTDAAINQGNSGGPLINLAGQVIGINTLVFRGGFTQAEGLGFAVSSNVARGVVQQLLETGQVNTPSLGIRYQELNQGVLLGDILRGTPASQAGLQAGDIILTIDGQQVDNRHPLISFLLDHAAGDTVTIEVLRDDATFETTLTLAQGRS